MKNFIFNWILLNELAIGSIPTRKEDYQLLKQKKIKSVISLTSEEEGSLYKIINGEFDCYKHILPDHKFEDNTKIEQVKEIINLMFSIKSKGPIFVHCFAAVERSPLICMAWLMQSHNLSQFEALEYVKRVNPSSNVLTSNYAILKNLKDYRK